MAKQDSERDLLIAVQKAIELLNSGDAKKANTTLKNALIKNFNGCVA